MRTLRLLPKVKVSLRIPEEFALFMAEVHQLILVGDECAVYESDDLLQCESAYGGLLEEGGSKYGFTYFPEEGVRVKWEVLLEKEDIERVAKGELKALELWQCKDPACRCAFHDESGSCFYCDWVDGNS